MLTRKQHELLVFIDRHLRTSGFSPSFEEMKEALQLKSKSGVHRLITALEERGFLRRRRHRARALEVLKLPAEVQPRSSLALRVEGRGVEGRGVEGRGVEGRGVEGRGVEGRGEAGGFQPNVIRGDFTSRLPGVRAAGEAAAVQIPLYGRIAAGLPIEALRDSGTQVEVPLAMLGGGDHYALEVAGDSMIEAGILDGDVVVIRKTETAENGEIVVALVDEAEVTLKRLRRRGQSIALEPANPRYEVKLLPAERVKVQGKLVALLRRY